ncbi:MAG: M18 family aminopeptidase, partial [Oscillospiraceae bacterium]
TTRNGSSLIAFAVPEKEWKGFGIIASHSDSPCFKLKETAQMQVEKNYTKLNVESYGGMIMSSWLDRPLSVAGRVVIKEGERIKTRLVNIDRDLLIIPNLAIHMQRGINDGYRFNPQIDLLPLLGSGEVDFQEFLAQETKVAKEDILSSDLFLYPRVEGTFFGAENEFIASPRLDDLQCVFASLSAFLQSENVQNVRVLAVFDNEEVGSGTKQGADSTFLSDVLTRLNDALGNTTEDYRCALANSMMLSADNAHAVHPNFPEKTDPTCKNYLNHGVVIKFNANQKYTTDALSAGKFKMICDSAKIPYQIFHNRSDMPGGSTLGNISTAHVSIDTVDIGIPQLAMHSAVETAGAEDTAYMQNAMIAFYNAIL